MNKPLITVAIPHYHRTHEESIFFENCLKSVMQQTIYDKCQVLLVDDCSPLQDALEHIVHRFSCKSPSGTILEAIGKAISTTFITCGGSFIPEAVIILISSIQRVL